MKKVISFILSLSILLCMCVPAFAADDGAAHDASECCDYPVIIVRGMEFNGLSIDYGTEAERPAIKAIEVKEVLQQVVKAVAYGVIDASLDSTIEVVIDYVYEILKGLSMNNKGESVYNAGQPKYPMSAGNYEGFREGGHNEYGMARACIENFGGDHTYYLNYDWRVDPMVIADEINEIVETAKKETGHDKVNLVCASMGGIMTIAYLSEYGYESVNRCLFMSSTFCGAQVASDLLTGKVSITADTLYDFLSNMVSDKRFVACLLKVLNAVGTFDGLTLITDYIVENYADEVYEKVLTPVFGYMLPLWGLVQPEDYNEAVEFMFGDSLEENAEFIKKTKALQDMMAGRDELLNDMIEDGVEIAIVAHYGTPLAPVYENSDFNGDGTLETRQMSGYATVAKYGETLGDDYVAENPEYLSPDRVVDLSTAILPEYTYIIKGAPHVSCNYGTDYSDFLIWLLSYDGDFYAGASEKYPQFMLSNSEQSLSAF